MMEPTLFAKADPAREAELQEEFAWLASKLKLRPLAPEWLESVFRIFKGSSTNSERGELYEELVSRWLGRSRHGVHVEKKLKARVGTEGRHDRVIEGVRTEIKGATLSSAKRGTFAWHQLRTNHDYELIILIGLSPTRAWMWVETPGYLHPHCKPATKGLLDLSRKPSWTGIETDGTLCQALDALKALKHARR